MIYRFLSDALIPEYILILRVMLYLRIIEVKGCVSGKKIDVFISLPLKGNRELKSWYTYSGGCLLCRYAAFFLSAFPNTTEYKIPQGVLQGKCPPDMASRIPTKLNQM